MQTTYRTDTHERHTGAIILTVSNISPVFREEEKTTVKKKIEQQLYEIFSKYMTVRS